MLERDLRSWNAVDVLGSSGLLQRGHVVDKTDFGLRIDFRLPNQTPNVYPYDKIFLISPAPDPGHLNGDLYVLHQVVSDQPWTWFPAKILPAVTSKNFVLAEFSNDGLCVRDLFHERFLRNSLPHPWEHVKADIFMKVSVPFPTGFNAGVSFRDLWKNLPFALLVDVGSTGFSYLTMKFLSMYQNTFRSFMFKKAAEMQSKKLTVSRVIFSGTPMIVKDIHYVHIHEIPFDILADAFSIMEATERTLCRRVCHNWNWVILSSSCGRVVKMDLKSMQVSSGKFAACLYKSLRFVKVLVLIGDHSTTRSVCLYRSATWTIKKILDVAGVKLSKIVLVDLRINGELLVKPGDFVITKPLRSCCARLLLKNVTVEHPLGHLFGRYRDEFRDDQHFHVDYCALRTDSTVGVRDVYETHFPPMTVLISFVHLSFAIAQAHQKSQKRFLKILRKWEYDDERFGPKCTWAHVQVAQLEKPDKLQTLRKTTLWLLVSSDQWQI